MGKLEGKKCSLKRFLIFKFLIIRHTFRFKIKIKKSILKGDFIKKKVRRKKKKVN